MLKQFFRWITNYNLRLSENYAVDLLLFHKVRNYSDGINYFSIDIVSDFYKGDHNPKFRLILIILNVTVFEFEVYNINHEEFDILESVKDMHYDPRKNG